MRISESLDELRALEAEIVNWHACWENSGAIRKHRTQLDFLGGLTRALIGVLIGDVAAIDPAADVRDVYGACRRADEQTHYVRCLWRYFADKFDQRSGPDDLMAATLQAADEVVWSCWKTTLKALGGYRDSYAPGPVPYLSPQFAASTRRPADYPGLNPDRYDTFAEHIRRLSIPVIALPPGCQRRPWWLVVAAHEVGHQVQWALPELDLGVQDAIRGATGGQDERWLGWRHELFADACAVLLMGPAVLWALAELETHPAPGPDAWPGSRYPPAQVRLAVARAVAAEAGLLRAPSAGQEVDALLRDLPADDSAGLAGQAPAVAAALLGVESASGARLRALANGTIPAYEEGAIGDWAWSLLRKGGPDAVESLNAARFCVAGSVAAWQEVAGKGGTDAELARRTTALAGRVRRILPACAEPGTRAGQAGTGGQAATLKLARELMADLGEITAPAVGEPGGQPPTDGASTDGPASGEGVGGEGAGQR